MTSSARLHSGPRAALAAAALALATLALAAPARAQFTLGDQRAGTSSGSFLKIGVGARATGLGESFVAVANDPTAIYWNPAGLASLLRNEVEFSHVSWPGDINYEHVAYVLPWKKIGGSLAFQVAALSTAMDETTELDPYGTGRQFVYSDFLAGAAYARRWTDKLLVGGGVKVLHEDLGSDVGGPTTTGTLFDVGGIYYLGLQSVRIAVSLTNFGSQLKPGGNWTSPTTGEVREYDGFDPPMMFRYGVALEPIETANQRLTTSIEIVLPADNAQVAKMGVEWQWKKRLALRSGYNFNADALKFSAGAGVYLPIASTLSTLDYAYTTGASLGGVNRLSLGVRF